MFKLLTAATFTLIVISAHHAVAGDKKTVCSITINSSDERELFKKTLPANEYQFVELVPEVAFSSQTDPDWLKTSCKPEIQCDILLISGHFAGTFFGKSKYDLPLEKMEEYSCSNECSGIFKRPKEVYLLGCNTLASKDKDSRTPEQYYNDLMADRIGTIAAQQAVAIRYSPLGNSNVERMQRVFAGVPRIYGFQSKGPLGQYNKTLLDKMFSTIGNYTSHLNQVEQEKISLIEHGQQPNISKSDWLLAMSGKKPANCSGTSPKDEHLNLICQIHTTSNTLEARLQALYNLLSDKDGQKYILVAHAFLQKNISQLNSQESIATLTKIKSLNLIRDELTKMIPLFENSLSLRLKLIELEYLVGWINFTEFESLAIEPVKKLIVQNVTYPTSKTICEYDHYPVYKNKYNFSSLKAADFHSSFYENASGLKATACLRLSDDAHVENLYKIALNKNSALYNESLDALGISGTRRPDVQKLFRDLLFSQEPEQVTAGLLGSARVGLTTDADVARIVSLKSHPMSRVSMQAETTYNYLVRVGLIKKQ